MGAPPPPPPATKFTTLGKVTCQTRSLWSPLFFSFLHAYTPSDLRTFRWTCVHVRKECSLEISVQWGCHSYLRYQHLASVCPLSSSRSSMTSDSQGQRCGTCSSDRAKISSKNFVCSYTEWLHFCWGWCHDNHVELTRKECTHDNQTEVIWKEHKKRKIFVRNKLNVSGPLNLLFMAFAKTTTTLSSRQQKIGVNFPFEWTTCTFSPWLGTA